MSDEAGSRPPADDKRPTLGALDGLRVLELGAIQAGPVAARWLAEAGAEVIKIEGLPGGDPIRGLKVGLTRGRAEGTHNWSHEYYNRNKKSIALNLDDPRARQIIVGLVRKSDVFITNLRSGSLRKWGLDYEALSAVNPRLVYAVAAGLGAKGPDAGRPALDMIGQARSGMLGMAGDLEGFGMSGGLAPCDKVAALQVAFGVMLALAEREKSGLGQKVEASLLGAGLYLAASELQYYLGTEEEPPGIDRRTVGNPLRNLYRTRDHRWIVLNMTQGDRYWPELCKALDLGHVQNDVRYATMAARALHSAEVIGILENTFLDKTKDEWVAILSAHNLIWEVVKNLSEVVVDPQVLENGYLVDSTSDEGLPKVVGPLISLSRTPLSIGAPAPELGQHTEEVLLESGDCTWQAMQGLKEAGLIL